MARLIRLGTVEDGPTVAQNNIDLAWETEDLRLPEEVVQQGVRAVLSDRTKGLYYVVEEAGAVVSQLMITFEWSDWRNAQVWWIQSVYTRKAHRRKGHYNALYQHVKAACREARAAGLRLYVDTHNKAAQELYARQGMRSHYLVYEDMESY